MTYTRRDGQTEHEYETLIGTGFQRLKDKQKKQFRLLYPAGSDDDDEFARKGEENSYAVTVNGISKWALYPYLSFVNHSCQPNATLFFNSRDGRASLVAFKPIPDAQTELRISYMTTSGPNYLFGSRRQRRKIFSRLVGGPCHCDLCSIVAPLRQRDNDLREELRQIILKLNIINLGVPKYNLQDSDDLQLALWDVDRMITLYSLTGLHFYISHAYAQAVYIYSYVKDHGESQGTRNDLEIAESKMVCYMSHLRLLISTYNLWIDTSNHSWDDFKYCKSFALLRRNPSQREIEEAEVEEKSDLLQEAYVACARRTAQIKRTWKRDWNKYQRGDQTSRSQSRATSVNPTNRKRKRVQTVSKATSSTRRKAQQQAQDSDSKEDDAEAKANTTNKKRKTAQTTSKSTSTARRKAQQQAQDSDSDSESSDEDDEVNTTNKKGKRVQTAGKSTSSARRNVQEQAQDDDSDSELDNDDDEADVNTTSKKGKRVQTATQPTSGARHQVQQQAGDSDSDSDDDEPKITSANTENRKRKRSQTTSKSTQRKAQHLVPYSDSDLDDDDENVDVQPTTNINTQARRSKRAKTATKRYEG